MVSTSVALYLGFLLLLAVERVGELILSARNAKRAFARGAVEVGQRHYKVMAALHTAFLFSCGAEVLFLRRPFPEPWGFIALAVAVLTQALRYWAIFTLGDRWNTRVIVIPGSEPVTRGPYRFLRHPNYVAVVAELAAVPLIHGAWLTAVLFTVANAFLLRVRIRAEENALGSTYQTAFGRLPRFIPELSRK
jgi:methyltransferase